jgi:hypothetical protein
MATLITKNSSTASSVPTNAQLVQGELAVNVTDKRLYTENASGTVVELGTNPSTLALPNGTSNGVAYLNGSKVLTTGSALTFDGTTFKASKAGTPFILAENTASSSAAIVQVKNTAGSTYLGQDSIGGYVLTDYAAPFLFYINNTEQMRLTSTGLGIGTSSPAYRLQVETASATGNIVGYFRQGSGAVAAILSTTDLVGFGNGASAGETRIYADGASGLITFRTNSTERARIDSSGNVGIGETSPGQTLAVKNSSSPIIRVGDGTRHVELRGGSTTQNSAVGTYYGGDFTFVTNSNERARITSGGYLLVGTTSAVGDARLVVNNPDNVSGDFCFVSALGSNCNNTSSYHYIAATNAADKFYVYGNGNVVNTNGSYGTLSDAKLKENIVDATPKLADVMRLQVRNFNLKTDPSLKQIGFVAQEFEQVFPGMVDESPDRNADNETLETTTKHIKTSVLIPILVKAIQELKTELDTVKAELNALKGT